MINNKMKNTKSSLTSRLGAFLLGATGLVGLAGCEAPQTQRQSIYQQPISSYSQQQTQPQTSDDGNLKQAIVGGILGAGFVGAGLPTNMNPTAKVLADVGTRGIGNGLLADSTRSKTSINVNVNPSNYSQPMQARTLDSRLLPEYNIDNLREEWTKANPKSSSTTYRDGVFSLYTSRIMENSEADGAPSFMGAKTNFRNSKNEKVRVIIGYNVLGKSLITNDAMASYTLSLKVLNDNGEVVYRDEISGKGEKFGKRIAQCRLPGLQPGVYHVECDYSSGKGHKSSKKAVFQVLE